MSNLNHSVALVTFGLTDVGEEQVGTVLRGQRDDPGDGGEGLHAPRPTRCAQENRGQNRGVWPHVVHNALYKVEDHILFKMINRKRCYIPCAIGS